MAHRSHTSRNALIGGVIAVIIGLGIMFGMQGDGEESAVAPEPTPTPVATDTTDTDISDTDTTENEDEPASIYAPYREQWEAADVSDYRMEAYGSPFLSWPGSVTIDVTADQVVTTSSRDSAQAPVGFTIDDLFDQLDTAAQVNEVKFDDDLGYPTKLIYQPQDGDSDEVIIAITSLHTAEEIEEAERVFDAWMPEPTDDADQAIERARLEDATGVELISSDEVAVFIARNGSQVCVLVMPADAADDSGSVTSTCPSVVNLVAEGTWLSLQPPNGPKTAVIVLPARHAADTDREIALVDTAADSQASGTASNDSEVIDDERAIIVTWDPPPVGSTTTVTVTSENGERTYPFEHSDGPPSLTSDGADDDTAGSAANPSEVSPVAYLPGGDWEVGFYLSDVTGPAREGAAGSQLRMATPEQGLFGPAVWTHFNPGLDRIDYGPSGGYNSATPAGTEVRVAQTISAASPLAIKLVEGGSIVVNGYDLTESELLQVVDTIDRVDGALVWNGDSLPQGMEALPQVLPSFDVGQYSLQRFGDDGERIASVNVMTFPEPLWQIPLSARATHPDWQLTEVQSEPAIVYGNSPESGADAGAIYVLDGVTYELTLQRNGPQDAFPEPDDVLEILTQIEALPIAEIADRLGLVTRQELYTSWLNDIELPPGTSIDWLLTNAYTNVEQEAFFAHQVFACLWAGEWIATGDQTALDMIENANEWPTATLIAADRGAAEGEQVFLPGPVIENPDGTSPAERTTDELRMSCGFVLGDDL